MTKALTNIPRVPAALPGSAGYFRICSRLIEIATKSNPVRAAAAPTVPTKKSCQTNVLYEATKKSGTWPSCDSASIQTRSCAHRGIDRALIRLGSGRSEQYDSRMAPKGLKCSFCGRTKPGGVAGPTTAIYICRECIELTYEIVHTPDESEGPA
jgi:ClpX C4-type zinc finger